MKIRNGILAGVIVLVLSACGGLSDQPFPSKQDTYSGQRSPIDLEKFTQKITDPNAPVLEKRIGREGGYVAYRDFDKSARNPNSPSHASANDLKRFEVDFEEVSLKAVIKFMFREFIKEPYQIDPGFKDRRVSWKVSGRYSVEEIKDLFWSYIEMQGVTINYSNDAYLVQPASLEEQKRREQENKNQSHHVQMWKLRYVNLRSIVPLITESLVSPERIRVLEDANILIATTTGRELRQLETFLERIDIAHLQGKSMFMYVPSHVPARTVAALLQNLPTRVGGQDKNNNRSVEAEVIAGTQRVVVVTESPEMKRMAMDFIEQIDVPDYDPQQVFYYPVRNQLAEQVKETLDELMPSIGLAEGDISLVVHEPTNSLLIAAVADQYFEIKKLIDRLDYNAPTAMIDATIVEVQLQDDLSYGVQWFLAGTGFGTAASASFDLTDSSITSPSTQIDVVSLSDNTFATLEFLASKTNLNILSRPRVMVKNKATAEIKSTDEIRVLKTQLISDASLDGSSLPQQEFEEKEVGITLRVTPTITDDGQISLQVEVEDSRQGDVSTITGQPTFNTRQVTTELVVQDTQTIMIGGLIQSSQRRSKRKVPVLGDIPMVGKAFSAKLMALTKPNLSFLSHLISCAITQQHI